MKILLTIDFPPEIGGIQRYLFDRVKHLFTNKDVVIAGTASPLSSVSTSLPCKYKFCTTPFSGLNKKWSLIPMFFILIAIVKKNKVSFIEAGNLYSALPVFLLSLLHKKYSYAVYCYGKELLPLQKRTLKSIIFKWVLERASQRYVLTNFTANLLKKAGINKSFIMTPPKIDMNDYAFVNKSLTGSDGKLDSANNAGRSSFTILTVGRLVAHKGHSVLIDAVCQIDRSIPLKLTIAGDGPEYENLMVKIKKDSLSDRVEIKRDLSNVQLVDEYKGADLFAFPSLAQTDGVEGFGIVLLEAMAFHLPVIATETGGIPEVLGKNCGILVPPGDVQSLCDQIINIYKDNNLRSTLADNGALRVRELFAW